MPKFYRDDDINRYTCVEEFRRIHKIFQRHNKIHTVACEMKDLWENKSLFWMLATDPLINVELHGWTHEDYSKLPQDRIYGELKMAIEYWSDNASRMTGLPLTDLKRITTFFPPWNKTSMSLFLACEALNLKVSHTEDDCHWMFHWWSTNEQEVEEKLR